MEAGSLPPFLGIRIKPLTEATRARSLRTLDGFLTALLEHRGGRLPTGFVLTLPKVTIPEQAAAMARVLEAFEQARRLPAGSLRFEIMVETPQAIPILGQIYDACAGRCSGAHFGAYDYTAGCGITAADQDMLHPVCDFARAMMQTAFGGTGVWLADGATNVMPVPVHRGETLTAEQAAENAAAVRQAWKLHYRHVSHSLAGGFYQSWDLHPAQLVTRYAAVYAYYAGNAPAVAARLRNFVARAAQATLSGNVFDDMATGQGLLSFFARALNCGAMDEMAAEALTGLSREQLAGGSFAAMCGPGPDRLD
jgi:hypothetical protein